MGHLRRVARHRRQPRRAHDLLGGFTRDHHHLANPRSAQEADRQALGAELFCLERNIPLYGFGSTTFRKEKKQRGLEPDECYSRDSDKPTPDIAIEVVVSHGLIDKLDVYRGLGIREVWVFEDAAFHIFTLRSDARDTRYEPIPTSNVIPEIDLTRLAHHVLEPDQHAALRAFRTELQSPTP